MLIRCVWDKFAYRFVGSAAAKGALLVTRRLVGALLIVGGLGLLTGGSASARSFAGFNGRIAFQSRVDGKDEIFLMDPDGSNITRLTNTPGHNNGCPAWSPDGSRIAFSSDRDGAQVNAFDTYDIYVMAADGSSVTRLTNTPGHDNTCPRWSPDGTMLVFTSDRDSASPPDPYFAEVYRMGADGSNQTRLTHHEALTSQAAWSPDGARIAYSTNSDSPGTDNYEIYMMDADGSNPKRLTNNAPFADFEPAWSPDGTRIAIMSKRNQFQWNIWTIAPDGSNPIQLTNTGAENMDLNPEWSPDGTKITFASNRAHDPELAVYVMDADGSHPTRLTVTAQGSSAGPSWESRTSPLESIPAPPPSAVDSTTNPTQAPTIFALPETGREVAIMADIALVFMAAGTTLTIASARRRNDRSK